jgi:hypothetical protein
MRNIRLLTLPAFLALAFTSAGCGPSMTKVSGKVTYKGNPVTGGTLTILPTNTKLRPVTVELKENGEFECTAPIGEAMITIDNRALKNPDKGAIGASGDYSNRDPGASGSGPSAGGRPGGPTIPGGLRPGAGGGGTGGPAQMPKNDEHMRKAMAEKGAPSSTVGTHVGTYVEIPKKYYSGSTTDITITIKSGEPLNIELKD